MPKIYLFNDYASPTIDPGPYLEYLLYFEITEEEKENSPIQKFSLKN